MSWGVINLFNVVVERFPSEAEARAKANELNRRHADEKLHPKWDWTVKQRGGQFSVVSPETLETWKMVEWSR